MQYFTCKKCGRTLPITEFVKNKNKKYGIEYTCKECNRKKVNEWRKNNPEKKKLTDKKYQNKNKEKISIKKRTYYLEHREEILKKRKEYYNKYAEKVKQNVSNYRKTEHGKLIRNNSNAKRRANNGTIDSSLLEELRKKTKFCPICGAELTNKPGPNQAQLDHIIPIHIGGIHDISNVRYICRTCNLKRPKYSSYKTTKFNQGINLIKNFLKEKFQIEENTLADIIIPEKSIAIDFIDFENYRQQNLKNARNYFFNRFLTFKEQGIRLIQIYEDEIVYKLKIVLSRLNGILGLNENKIHGRKCKIKEIQISSKFEDTFHIQGSVGTLIKLGAFYNDELVSVISFGAPRTGIGKTLNNKDSIEIVRFTVIFNTTIHGIFGKFLHYFFEHYPYKKLYTYSDNRWDTGNVYLKNGFSFSGYSSPSYFYIIDGIRKHRYQFRKNNLHNKLNEFNPSLTEYENMLMNGFDRIWDAGTSKWELNQ